MRQRAYFLFPLLIAICFGGISRAQEVAVAEPPNAASLLKEMEKTYATAKSYEDRSTAIYHNRDGSERLTVAFRIWFARPGSFRVDAESTPADGTARRREVLWTDGVLTRTWATDRAVASRAHVQLVGSGMFGTYAYHVPTLLEANYGAHRRLHQLTLPKLLGVETFEGVQCYYVRGQWEGDKYEIWLGKEDHLVRKIVATYSDHVLEEVHRDIVVNRPIPPEAFRFAPEKEAAKP